MYFEYRHSSEMVKIKLTQCLINPCSTCTPCFLFTGSGPHLPHHSSFLTYTFDPPWYGISPFQDLMVTRCQIFVVTSGNRTSTLRSYRT